MTRTAVQPQQRLDRVRLAMTLFGALMCLTPVVEGLIEPIDELGVALSLSGGLGVIGLIAITHARKGRIPVVLVPVQAALLVAMTVGLTTAVPVMGACLGVVASQTMYGSRRSILLRTACLLLVLPLSTKLSLSAQVGDQPFSLRLALTVVPIVPLFTGLIYLLRNTLESQATTIAREGFMARLSRGLLAAETIHDITRAMVRANDEFEQASPGMVTLELRRVRPGDPGPEGGAQLLNSHGVEGYEPPEFLPAAVLTELPPLDVDSETPLPAVSSALEQLGLPARSWHAVTLEQLPGAPCDLILHGVQTSLGQKLFGVPTPEETEFLDVRRRLRAHWRSTMARMQRRDALIEAAEQDEVTGLPDRTATMRRVVELVHTSKERVGLVLIEIIGLGAVEAQSGISAVDTAMRQLAHRVTAVVDGRGRVGRGGDGSFAVVLTNADSYDEVETLVDRLEDALLEPVLLPGGAVQLDVRFGVARTTVSGTAADLLERAVSSLAIDLAGRPDASANLRMEQA